MPHDFRRSFITRVIEEFDLSIAQKLAHHTHIATTASYDMALAPQVENLTLLGTASLSAQGNWQTNEITGVTQLMTKAIGKALADDIPTLFSETIFTVREGTQWYWDTAAANVDTKTRYLPIASKIKPDFAQIMDKWQERGKI